MEGAPGLKFGSAGLASRVFWPTKTLKKGVPYLMKLFYRRYYS